jgi:hypothetical protein
MAGSCSEIQESTFLLLTGSPLLPVWRPCPELEYRIADEVRAIASPVLTAYRSWVSKPSSTSFDTIRLIRGRSLLMYDLAGRWEYFDLA